ncbi:hypothetical protein OESDEN_23101 [Oesophagostomum dentatum]|uniref:Uncharacterized protein n=1 Tax=Oesophagostomum dentatum TaxID=61180 RepID=A0A0B1RX65_OESDE|nr:hypothetical protein OESDEN_23101 [Oesophagostomum dentatum]
MRRLLKQRTPSASSEPSDDEDVPAEDEAEDADVPLPEDASTADSAATNAVPLANASHTLAATGKMFDEPPTEFADFRDNFYP